MKQAEWQADGERTSLKRTSDLFEKVISWENLHSAFRLAMRGCGRTHASCRFFCNLEREIIYLQKELTVGRYRPSAYRQFTVSDPKVRIISVAPFRDRVVHHAIVRVLDPVFDKIFIFDSYATRKNKGTHKAIYRAAEFTKKWPWYLKADVRKYFDSVSHDILLKIVSRKIKDQRLTNLLGLIVRNVPDQKGLPIGNLTSQFLANVYLDAFDHEMKDRLGIKGYVRYMDDFVIFGNSSSELAGIKQNAGSFLENELELKLKAGATYINKSSHGLSFLGMRIFPRIIRVMPASRRRCLKKLAEAEKKWLDGKIADECLVQTSASIIGHLRYFCPDARIIYGNPGL